MTREQPPVRIDPLSEAAARRHELTRAKAVQALRELDRAGAPVTFAAVAQAAGFSELRDNAAVQEVVQPERRTAIVSGKSSWQVHNGLAAARALPKADMRR